MGALGAGGDFTFIIIARLFAGHFLCGGEQRFTIDSAASAVCFMIISALIVSEWLIGETIPVVVLIVADFLATGSLLVTAKCQRTAE